MENMLKELREEYVGKEIKLLELDNDMCNRFHTKSIYDYNVREMFDDGFCYQANDNPEGFNFQFEVVEDNGNNLEYIIKVIDIYLV